MLNWTARSSDHSLAPLRSRRRTRALMLGAVGAAALAGSAASVAMPPAHAEAPLTQGMNFSGPVSFADMVDRVKGAVVAVKVNMVEKADSEAPGFGGEGLPPGMPPMSPDDPLYRFFKRFGGQNGGPNGAQPHPHRISRGDARSAAARAVRSD